MIECVDNRANVFLLVAVIFDRDAVILPTGENCDDTKTGDRRVRSEHQGELKNPTEKHSSPPRSFVSERHE